jgi:putative endopeptidase
MGPETRAKALEKLAAFRVKIGYPDKWKDYSSMEIKPGDLLGNVRAASLWSWRYEINKLGKPVDKDEWQMTPQTVNAYYNPGTNEITFPGRHPAAAVLRSGGGRRGELRRDRRRDRSRNWSRLRRPGPLYDATGKLEDWWTKADGDAFKKRASGLVQQYSAFEVLPGLKVNGELTLGENIGDLGGLGVAYQAYQRSLGGKPAPTLEGLTGDQRFFLAYAQAWQTKIRDGELRARVLSDPHSPPYNRVNGTVPKRGRVVHRVRRQARRQDVPVARTAREDLAVAVFSPIRQVPARESRSGRVRCAPTSRQRPGCSVQPPRRRTAGCRTCRSWVMRAS